MGRMKAGIIGCGNISSTYLENLRNSPLIEVVAVADLLEERARARADEFNIENVYKVDELLRQPEIELVFNLTVPGSHALTDVAILEAGKHVYSEKPLAVSLEEGKRVLELSQAKNLRVGCAPDTFLGAGMQTARHAIQTGMIGQPVAATAFLMGRGPEWWHENPEFFYAAGGGPMFDMGPYYLTSLIHLLGPIRRISGSVGIQIPERYIHSGPKSGTPLQVETPTHLAGTLDFHNGAIATLITSFDIQGASELPRIEIYGTKGTLNLPDPNFFNGDVKLRQPEGENTELLKPLFECGKNERGIGACEMVRAIRGNKKHRANAELAYHVLEAMHAFQRSSLEGRHITLESTYEPDEELYDGADLTVNPSK
ncbi:Gfo/Idh/MocA family protein [Paenibacillus farraposensis]|uniref:Gfo/Idh/MocA family protein n=1 Tax=Paenibacillus farraposensis TaxID=2807095 RepID=A0ABW4DGT2_9BACL|nr:Gfo/Idh/MocA family oxidoreductase [Paenibacillus farraposensis]MCC3379758.1 Gfo/Idh/MocA family oxidoreductase [Paenibacillus farraposensis]